MKTLCVESDSLLFPALWYGAEDDGISHRCHQIRHGGTVIHHSEMDGARVGEKVAGAGVDVGEDDDGTHSCRLSVLHYTLHTPLDLSRALICLECAGDKCGQLK